MDTTLDFINVSDMEFYESDGHLLCLKIKGEDFGRVSVLRMFPLELEEEYLCVKCENYSKEDKEVGIIHSLTELSQSQAVLVRNELSKRYFIPEIVNISEVKEELSHTLWKVETTAGEREFTVTDMNSNVRNMGSNRIMLTDVYGNRYYIPDVTKIEEKAMKILEIWI